MNSQEILNSQNNSGKGKQSWRAHTSWFENIIKLQWASQVELVVKNPPANAGDIRDEGLIPGLERSPEVISWPLLYFIGSASKASKQSLRRVRLFVIPWTVVYQASLSMGFSRQEYWSGLLFPSPGNLPDPGIKPRSSALQADALPSEPPGKPTIGSEYWFKIFFLMYVFKAINFL